MDQRNPAQDPDRTPRLQPHVGVPPGETPPAEDGLSETGPQETYNPTKGWSKGPTIVIWLFVALFVAFCIAFAVDVLR